TDRDRLLRELQENLSENCLDFDTESEEQFEESAAMCGEEALEQYLAAGHVEEDTVRGIMKRQEIFRCYFRSSLKMEGVDTFLHGLERWMYPAEYGETFGARVYKISRDAQGSRLTHMKITGGALRVRDMLGEGEQQEKVNQIRIYSGEKYETAGEAQAGTVCAVTGLTKTVPGQGFGMETGTVLPLLEPVLDYHVILPERCDAAVMLPRLRELEEEEPLLHIVWDETLQEIHAKVMGEVQLEILQGMIRDRYGTEVSFDNGSIVYKETIDSAAEGVGHFEPLRHYAEVHLLLEPAEPGSGLQFASKVSEDELDRNWQRLILTHLREREHKGVLTGSAITDMRITLAAGRAHPKHTQGGDFREATYRALRQGLKQARCILLEPLYEFSLEVPEQYVGRAMTDIERMCGKCGMPERMEDAAGTGMCLLRGRAPVQSMRNYQKEVTAYTRGEGRLLCEMGGYGPCHNSQEVMEEIGYDSEADMGNPAGSVFCAHGAGFIVPWYEVHRYMHLESRLYLLESGPGGGVSDGRQEEFYDAGTGHAPGGSGSSPDGETQEERWIGTDEIDAILSRTYYANRREETGGGRGWGNKTGRREETRPPVSRNFAISKPREDYLLVDGYNIIFAWEDLRELAKTTIDGARGKLLDILCDYQGIKKCHLIAVFDAYRVQGHRTEISDYHNIHVVFTAQAETADQYIEKFAHENGKKYNVTVATSDGLEQIIIRGQGCALLSARELLEEVERTKRLLREEHLNRTSGSVNRMAEHLGQIRLPQDS
ncbi:MAG: translation elongation factor G, partial [Lachnospiraceae bacterium]|nr:translation elongation factor G [Lachnospiraceae bacterium]